MESHKSSLFFWLMAEVVGYICFSFLVTRIVSHLPFACNWQFFFWNSEPVIAHFSSNKGGTLYLQIPQNSTELHPAPYMHVVCRVHGLGLSHTLKKNVLSLILLISLVELTNQKRGIGKHIILYLLWLKPLLPNDIEILKSKVGLGPNQIEIKLFYETKKAILGKERSQKP